MNREQFIANYVPAYLAADAVLRSHELAKHDSKWQKEVTNHPPVEDAEFLAGKHWEKLTELCPKACDANTEGRTVATDRDHRIIDSVSYAMKGQIGSDDDVQRLRAEIENGPSDDKLKTACEIAVAFIRWSQDLKAERKIW